MFMEHMLGYFSKFHSHTHGLFEEIGRRTNRKGGIQIERDWRNVPFVGPPGSLLSMFFLSAHHMIPINYFPQNGMPSNVEAIQENLGRDI